MVAAASPVFTVFNQGQVSPGAKVYTYIWGTTTLLETYADAALTTPSGNPMTADANGQVTFFLSTMNVARLELFTADGAFIRAVEPVYPAAVASGGGGSGEASIPASSTTDLGETGLNLVKVTGSADIVSLGASASTGNPLYTVRFAGSPKLIHDPVSLILPGGQSIQVSPNDAAIFEYIGDGKWLCLFYQRAAQSALVNSVIGSMRNAKMSVASASATGTFTADSVVMATALNGAYQTLPNFSQAVNLATTGAGGMDTGTAPANGFVSLYAIAKPDGTQGIIACNAATSAGSVYAGAYMPSGYSYSSLLGIWPTNGSGQFLPGLIFDREFFYQTAPTIFTNANNASALTSQSISAAVPAAAKTCSGVLSETGSNGVPNSLKVAADGTGLGAQFGPWTGVSNVPNAATMQLNFRHLPILTAQTIYWQTGNSNSGSSNNNFLNIGSYTI